MNMKMRKTLKIMKKENNHQMKEKMKNQAKRKMKMRKTNMKFFGRTMAKTLNLV